MTRVVAELRPRDRPFGVDFLWDPGAALAIGVVARDAVDPGVPVLVNTGSRSSNISGFLSVATGCIVGSDLKVDGYTWNPVDPARVKRFMEAARS